MLADQRVYYLSVSSSLRDCRDSDFGHFGMTATGTQKKWTRGCGWGSLINMYNYRDHTRKLGHKPCKYCCPLKTGTAPLSSSKSWSWFLIWEYCGAT